MMSGALQMSYERAVEYDKGIWSSAFRDRFVLVIHDDGSQYLFRYAFAMDDEVDSNYVWVFAEHQNPLAFPRDEVTVWDLDIKRTWCPPVPTQVGPPPEF